ncbi:MAG: glycosyltransferase, partial [Cyanothece sp. SIO1E1]|nr:glycosyltransferase [Cyanothece sp. SIO1E1]
MTAEQQIEGCNYRDDLPKVSVIVPVYNGEADLPHLAICLCAQTYPAQQVEYLIVDNGSCDRTASLLQTLVSDFAAVGLTLRILSETQIQSSYAARNAGICVASGEIFAFTDADCRPQPDWLRTLIQPFEDSAISLVAGEIKALPGTTLWEKYADREDTLTQKHTLAHPFCPYGQTANLAIRRMALEKVGLFRPYLTTGGDADICWRIQRQGAGQLYFADQAIVQHRHRTTIQDLRKQWARYGRSNRYLHELHGVKLMRDLAPREYLHRMIRWCLKELPITGARVMAGKTPAVDLLRSPIGLF